MALAPGDQVTNASYAKYQEQYPQFAWAFSDPEVAYWLDRAMREKMGPDELAGWIQKTGWWKSKTNAERDWLQTLATNPADATKQMWNYNSIHKYMSIAGDYGLPVDFDTAQRQVSRVVQGFSTPEELEEELRRQAIALYPHLADQISKGATVKDVYAPYKTIASQMLGINDADISLTDPKWQAPMQIMDKGVRRLATTDEWMTILRTDAKYGYDKTTRARGEAAEFATAIGQMFGNIG